MEQRARARAAGRRDRKPAVGAASWAGSSWFLMRSTCAHPSLGRRPAAYFEHRPCSQHRHNHRHPCRRLRRRRRHLRALRAITPQALHAAVYVNRAILFSTTRPAIAAHNFAGVRACAAARSAAAGPPGWRGCGRQLRGSRGGPPRARTPSSPCARSRLLLLWLPSSLALLSELAMTATLVSVRQHHV